MENLMEKCKHKIEKCVNMGQYNGKSNGKMYK